MLEFFLGATAAGLAGSLPGRTRLFDHPARIVYHLSRRDRPASGVRRGVERQSRLTRDINVAVREMGKFLLPQNRQQIVFVRLGFADTRNDIEERLEFVAFETRRQRDFTNTIFIKRPWQRVRRFLRFVDDRYSEPGQLRIAHLQCQRIRFLPNGYERVP